MLSLSSSTRKLRLSDIKDGTSNTFLVGEVAYNPARMGQNQYGLGGAWAQSPNTSGSSAIPPNAPDLYPTQATDWTGWNGFGSNHPSGTRFGLCDGSVRFIADQIDLATCGRVVQRPRNHPTAVTQTCAEPNHDC